MDGRVKRLMRSYRLPVDVLDEFTEQAGRQGMNDTAALIEAMELWTARQQRTRRPTPPTS